MPVLHTCRAALDCAAGCGSRRQLINAQRSAQTPVKSYSGEQDTRIVHELVGAARCFVFVCENHDGPPID